MSSFRNFNTSLAPSVSTMTSMNFCAASYSEMAIPSFLSRHHEIHRLYPILADSAPTSSDAPQEVKTGASQPSSTSMPMQSSIRSKERVRALVHKLCAKHPGSSDFVVQWKGRTPEEVEKSLVPVVYHYKIQLLLLEEARGRRVVQNEEFTGRITIQIECRYGTPLQEKLIGWYRNSALSGHPISLSRNSSKVSSRRSPSLQGSRFFTPLSPENSTQASDACCRTKTMTFRTEVRSSKNNVASFEQTLRGLMGGNTSVLMREQQVGTPTYRELSVANSVATVSRRLMVSEEATHADVQEINSPPKKERQDIPDDEDSLAQSVIGTCQSMANDSLEHSLFGDGEETEIGVEESKEK